MKRISIGVSSIIFLSIIASQSVAPVSWMAMAAEPLSEMEFECHFSPSTPRSILSPAPTNLSILDEEPMHVINHTPAFSWQFNGVNEEDHQEGFHIQVCDNDEPPQIYAEANTTSSESLYIYGSINQSNDLVDGSFYWSRVKTLDDEGIWSGWSDTFRFRMNTPPSKPVLLSPGYSAIVNKSAPRLAWGAAYDADGDDLEYDIQIGLNGSSWGMAKAIRVNDTEYFLDENLTDGSTYNWRVSASDGHQTGDYSTISTFHTNYTVNSPTAPMNLSSRYAPYTVTLRWERPISDSGSAVTDYIIYRSRFEGKMTVAGFSNSTTFTDKDLVGRSIYFYRIAARNEIGEGDRSTILKVLAGDLPSKPGNVRSRWQNKSVNLSWNEPIDDGGFEIRCYRIYERSAGDNFTFLGETPLNGYHVSGLVNGVVYYYGISAVSLSVEGDINITSGIPQALPTAVGNLTAISTGRTVRLSWETPAEDGGADILYYKVFNRRWLSDPVLLGSSAEREYEVIGVASGANWFTVKGVSIFGEGDPSGEIYVYIENDPPNANFSIDPGPEGSLSTIFSLTSSSIDPDGTIITASWDFGDGVANYSNKTTHSYKKPGEYIVTLTVTDDEGAGSSCMKRLTVLAAPSNHPPVFADWYPASDNFSLRVGETVRFIVEAQDVDRDGIQYRWSVDGVHKAEGREFLFKPGKPGDRIIKVTVSDGKDNTTMKWDIAVKGFGPGVDQQQFPVGFLMMVLILITAFTASMGLYIVSRKGRAAAGQASPEVMEDSMPGGLPETAEERNKMYSEISRTLSELREELATPSDVLKLKRGEEILRDLESGQADPGTAYLALTELISSLHKSHDKKGVDLDFDVEVVYDSGKVISRWTIRNPGDTVVTDVIMGLRHDRDAIELQSVDPPIPESPTGFVLGNLGPGEKRDFTIFFNALRISSMNLTSSFEYRDFKGQVKKTGEKTIEVNPGSSTKDTIHVENHNSREGAGRRVSPVVKTDITPMTGTSETTTGTGRPLLVGATPISNPFKDHASALKSLSSLPRGLPGSLAGMSLDELSDVIAASEFHETRAGDIIVKIGRKWYYGDPGEADTYLQPYRKLSG